jgi:hypothetical protein
LRKSEFPPGENAVHVALRQYREGIIFADDAFWQCHQLRKSCSSNGYLVSTAKSSIEAARRSIAIADEIIRRGISNFKSARPRSRCGGGARCG